MYKIHRKFTQLSFHVLKTLAIHIEEEVDCRMRKSKPLHVENAALDLQALLSVPPPPSEKSG